MLCWPGGSNSSTVSVVWSAEAKGLKTFTWKGFIGKVYIQCGECSLVTFGGRQMTYINKRDIYTYINKYI